ncbi:AI-2E family transporter [Granulosicoccus sp. 3-233]|uniref:AI-2E family transporter n=1 Tax=Granulosicoccus sp. 3-233 TaxID=3417969 RepID=UPI003D328681
MYDIFRDWYARNFSDPQAVILAFLLLMLFGLLWLVGDIMAPVLVALVLAYLLESVVVTMQRWHVPRTLASVFILLIILALSLIVIFGLVPVLSQQLTGIVRELPGMVGNIQEQMLRLPEKYPDIFTVDQVNDLIDNLRRELTSFTQSVLSFSLAQLGSLVMIAVYVVLVPIMVFFALKDKDKLLTFAAKFVPHRSELSFQVWREVDEKIANYIRGKFVEVIIIWVVTYILFAVMGLNYSLLLSFLVGLSVIIPYVGAIAVTVPIALIGFFQWGLTAKLGYLLIAYQIIQILDGNVLVPLLFSEVVNLHPLAIIAAVLFFGGLFGLWGVFFAIPLATLVQAVMNAWPKARDHQSMLIDGPRQG